MNNNHLCYHKIEQPVLWLEANTPMKLLLLNTFKQNLFLRDTKNETKIKLRNISPKLESVAKCHIERRRKKIANIKENMHPLRKVLCTSPQTNIDHNFTILLIQ